MSGVPAGSYLLMARVQIDSVSTASSQIACETSLGGKTSSGVANVGTTAGNTAHDVVTIAFNVTLGSTGTAKLVCYQEALSGTAPNASGAYVELLQVGAASSQTVSG